MVDAPEKSVGKVKLVSVLRMRGVVWSLWLESKDESSRIRRNKLVLAAREEGIKHILMGGLVYRGLIWDHALRRNA